MTKNKKNLFTIIFQLRKFFNTSLEIITFRKNAPDDLEKVYEPAGTLEARSQQTLSTEYGSL